MSWIESILSADLVVRLGWTLIHSLWQGAAVAAVVALLLLVLPRRQANARYAVCCLALLAVTGSFAATFLLVGGDVAETPPVAADVAAGPNEASSPVEAPAPVATAAAAPAPPPTGEAGGVLRRALSRVAPHVQWLVPAWLCGVLALTVWHLGGWIAVHRLRSVAVRPVSTDWTSQCAALSRALGVRRCVRVLQSALATTPMVVGLLKPIILLPAGVLTGLPTPQIEAILAHELAHVRRWDYLVNLLQGVVETVLFHHPAVWWLSHRIRLEREYCCDDLAAGLSGSRVDYARALVGLETSRAPVAPAVAAGGGSLLARVRRIVGQPAGGSGLGQAWLAPALVLLLCAAVPLGAIWAQGTSTDDADDSPASRPATITVRELDNPLGLDTKMLTKLFWTGRAIRAVRSECSTFYVMKKRFPKSTAEAFELHPSLASRATDPFAPAHQIRVVRDAERLDVVRFWSVGPDGDWDGGRRIDSTKPGLDGDLGAELSLRRGRFRWLTDETLGMHLKGHRLCHYLGAKAPKLPKPALKDDGLAWGPPVDGLSAAAELVPKRDDYALGEKIELRFHIRNVSDHAITVAGETWRQEAGPNAVIVEDQQGRRCRVGHSWYSGRTPTKRQMLKPGEKVVVGSSGLAFTGRGVKDPGHPVGHRIQASPGRYRTRFTIRLPGVSTSGPGFDGIPQPTDWQGTLETGRTKLRVVRRPKPPAATATRPAAKRP